MAADGLRLALRRVGDQGAVPVVLAHGTFSNMRSCAGLAAFLARQGFAAWMFDWRGHGASGWPDRPHDFDAVALLDVPAVIETVTARGGRPDLFWVGHSGGGLVAAMWMARFPDLAARHIRGLAMLASQATHAAAGLRHRLAIHGVDWVLRGRRTAPGHYLRIGPEPESAPLMRQWCRWNLAASFVGMDGFNYMRPLAQLTTPVLALAGTGDRFIAPADGCRALAHAFGGPATFHLCGKSQGFLEDYTHNRIVLSRSASLEIWPLVSRWLQSQPAVLPGTQLVQQASSG